MIVAIGVCFPSAVWPSGNVMTTVEPGSALPPISFTPSLIGLIVGAGGAVVSITVIIVALDVLPDVSVDVTLM